jgi:hypothetical protein
VGLGSPYKGSSMVVEFSLEGASPVPALRIVR